MKQVQLSNSDFNKFIKENYYYVDKTLLIEELLIKQSQVILLPRPRRFGKTLNLSMLKYYFDIREDNKELFKGLNIEKSNLFNKHINKYPTIFLTLKEVKGLTWGDIYDSLKVAIADLYKDHIYLLSSNKIDNYDKELINKIIRREADKIDYKYSLYRLSEYMYKHYGKELVILLDEYDTAMNSFYEENTYNNISDFLRIFIGSSFKDNKYLFKGVITGILRIAKESIFSGANNILVQTVLDNSFSDKFGFTENEVIATLKYFKLENKIDEVRDWYNGYTFGNNIIYNPYSIVNFVDSKVLKSYWINTSNNSLIKELLINSDTSVKEKLEELIKGNSIEEEIEESIVFNELHNSKYLWSLFLFSGYLKATQSGNKYLLSIPNEEIRKLYRNIVEDCFNRLTKNSLKIIEYIKEGNVELLEDELRRILMNIVSIHDIKDENSIHMLMISFLYYLQASGDYEVKSNLEAGYGRYDLCIIPKDTNKIGYLIEIKKSKGKVEEDANKALEQIEEKKYYAELINKKIKNFILLGLAFKNKNIFIKSKKIIFEGKK